MYVCGHEVVGSHLSNELWSYWAREQRDGLDSFFKAILVEEIAVLQ